MAKNDENQLLRRLEPGIVEIIRRTVTGDVVRRGGTASSGGSITAHDLNDPVIHLNTLGWGRVSKTGSKLTDLGDILHDMITVHRYTGGAALDVFGLTAPSTLGVITPTDDPALTSRLLKTNSSGSIELQSIVSDDADRSYQLGRAHVGYVGFSDFAGFAHRDRATTTNYAYGQSASGITYLNSSGLIAHTIGGTTLMEMTASRLNIYSPLAIGTSNYASQVTGWNATYAGAGDFRYLFVDEMHAKSFIADLEQALAGGQIISKSVAVLFQDFTAPAAGGTATLKVKDLPSAPNMAVFQSGDIVRIRSFSRSGGGLSITDCWGVVTGYTDQPSGDQDWTFTRSSAPNAGAMTAGAVVAKDAIVLDYGTTGNGFYEVNAIDGIYAVNSPYSQIVTWATHPATGQTVRVRLGNLTGLTFTGEYGLYAQGATNADYIKATSAGLLMRNGALQMYDGADKFFSVDATDGVNIAIDTTDYDFQRAYSFTSGGTEYAGLYMAATGTNRYLRLNSPSMSKSGLLWLGMASTGSTNDAAIQLQAEHISGSKTASMYLLATNTDAYLTVSCRGEFAQSGSTAAQPVLALSQTDLSEEFVNFIGTVGTGNSIDTGALGSYHGKIRIAINGTFYFIPAYNP